MNVRELIGELVAAWQSYDAHRASAFFAPNGIYRESGREPIVGREAIYEHFKRFFRDGPAWQLGVEEIIVEGDRAAVVYRFDVKDARGEWRARAGCAIVRHNGGSIVEWREFMG
jgi:uncharacterized protein (TIGR02246 family)